MRGPARSCFMHLEHCNLSSVPLPGDVSMQLLPSCNCYRLQLQRIHITYSLCVGVCLGVFKQALQCAHSAAHLASRVLVQKAPDVKLVTSFLSVATVATPSTISTFALLSSFIPSYHCHTIDVAAPPGFWWRQGHTSLQIEIGCACLHEIGRIGK